MQERTGIIVWLQHMKQVNHLKKYGALYYTSKRMKYAVLYCDTEQTDQVSEALRKKRFVKDVSVSPFNQVKTEYEKPSWDRERAL